MSNAELVVVGTFLNRVEAAIAQGALEAAEIDSIVSADDAGGVDPSLWMGWCGYWFAPKMLSERAGWSSQSNPLPSKQAHWQLRPELCYSRTRYENEKRQECNRLVLAREQKQSVVDTYRTHATDTGSPEVQIALLSERIGQLTEHFKTHQKDHGSRRGLLMMVSRRRGLLDYLKKYDSERYKTVITKLGIRK